MQSSLKSGIRCCQGNTGCTRQQKLTHSSSSRLTMAAATCWLRKAEVSEQIEMPNEILEVDATAVSSMPSAKCTHFNYLLHMNNSVCRPTGEHWWKWRVWLVLTTEKNFHQTLIQRSRCTILWLCIQCWPIWVQQTPSFLPGPGLGALLSSYLEGALYKFHR